MAAAAAVALVVAPPLPATVHHPKAGHHPATEHLPREVDSAVASVAELHRPRTVLHRPEDLSEVAPPHPPTELPLPAEALVDLSVVVLHPPLTELHPSVETHPRRPTVLHRLVDPRVDLSEVAPPPTPTDLHRPATVLPLLVDPLEVAAVSCR